MLAECLAPTAPAPALSPEQVVGALLALSDRSPTDPELHLALAQAYRAAGQEIEARAEECGAAALRNGMPLVLFNIATAYFTTGYADAASRWYRLTVTVEPRMAIAHQNLACILSDQGRVAEARAHRDLAFRDLCIFTSRAPQERRRVLILAAAGTGNIPLQHLLPREVNSQATWFMEYTRPDTAASLAPYDIVLNGVGDPDLDGPTYDAACAFLQTCPKPSLNHPDRVSHTRRDRLPALLSGIAGMQTPAVLRVRSAEQVTAAGLAYPLLVRPAGSHGGAGLMRLDGSDELRTVPFTEGEAWYFSPFQDYRSADGYWRKYRIIYVDGEPYPYHLAISPHWLVHYVTADMLSDPAKCREEQRFLEQPEAVLGDAGMAAIREIGRRLNLDYAGVDFTILPDGELLVFEANATMLVHPETHPKLVGKNPFVTRILQAFETLLCQRIAAVELMGT